METKNKEAQISLPPETWELLEYRMWSKLSSKLWGFVGGFIALVTLVIGLGLSSYIENKVETKLQEEQQKLRTSVQNLENKLIDQAIRASLLNYSLFTYQKDRFTFKQYLEEAVIESEEIEDPQLREIVSELLGSLNNFELDANQLNDAITELGNLTNNKLNMDSDHKLDTQLISEISSSIGVETLDNLISLYVHLTSMQALINRGNYFLFKPNLANAVTTAKFINKYENELFPVYKEAFSSFDTSWTSQTSRGKDFHWSTMTGSMNLHIGLTKILENQKN